MPVGVASKKIYLDYSGDDYYSADISEQVKNSEGVIKVDDMLTFERKMIEIKKPIGLAKFILEELGFSADIYRN